MRYDIDLTKVSLEQYRQLLQKQNLLPSRRLLLQDLDARFTALETQGIANAAQLMKALAAPAKFDQLAAKAGIPQEYLTVLKRELGTLLPKNVSLTDFPGIDPAAIESLRERGIKTSKAYFEQSDDTNGELYALCNLVRINGIGPNAAKMFYEAGYRSPAEIAAADAETILIKISAQNADHRYYQGTLGFKDMRFCVESAQMLLRCCAG